MTQEIKIMEPSDIGVSPGQRDADPLIDFQALQRSSGDLRAQYLAARPWPHLVLHDLFRSSALVSIKEECVLIPPRQMNRQDGRAQVKEETSELPGPESRRMFELFEGPEFINFLEQITGVDELISDPSHVYAGVHRSRPGAFTLIHRDFRRHPQTMLHHRVNVLLYLNQDWQESFGGHLELWPSDMARRERLVVPSANTLVLWETHDQTLHGFPEPVACPPGDARIALASYYYTTEPRSEKVKRRGPVFARRPQDSWRTGRRPPAQVLRAIIDPDRAF
jgi:Rps23 Pro-64 3,4-dihydroxylase Tpa1-like proline 4-hydroxylase